MEPEAHKCTEPRQEVDRQCGRRGANQSPWPPRKCQNPPERHEKPSCVAQRPSADDPPLASPAPQTRTLRLQESDARSKTKVLDHRAQENGQGCRKQLCPLPETAQKTPRSIDGPSAKFTSGSWVPAIFEHGYTSLQEAQVVIFSCTTTRAIHLELVTDKSSEAFLMAFRRFACLHGHPNVCWSDCGSNFVGAQEYLREAMQHRDIPKIQSAISEEFACDFEWQWNTPHASHQNGVVESLIKSFRQALNSVCKNQAFTEEQWRTFLAEITYIVNSRPLYPNSEDIWDEPPITPNHLLIGQHSPPPQPELEARVNPRHLLRSV